MKFVGSAVVYMVAISAFLVVGRGSSKRAQSPGLEEAVSTAVDAYLYGYPLVTFDMVRQQWTNVAMPDAEHAPIGQVIKMRTYPAVDNHCCAAPNADPVQHGVARRLQGHGFLAFLIWATGTTSCLCWMATLRYPWW
jgi:hypothetical protein